MLNRKIGIDSKIPEYYFYKENEDDPIYKVEHTTGEIGELLYSFGGKTILNLWKDYPWNFKEEQKEIFDKQEPYWADFFKARCETG